MSQANTKLMQVNPTIAAGDFKVSIDGGALANLGTLPAVTPAGSTMVKFTLSTSEMAGANATVVCIDAAGSEWCDLVINIPTAARQVDDLAFPATTGRSMVVDANGLVDANAVKLGPTGSGTAQTARDVGASVLLSTGTGTGQLDFTSGIVKANATQILGTAVSTPATAGILDVNVKNMNNVAGTPITTIKAVQGLTTADTIATYTGNTVQTGDGYARLGAPAGASHAADVAAVKVDTAAVKVQTDKLAFTVANQVDSNVLDWKSATAPAMTGDAFARLGAPAGASVSADVAAAKVDTAAIKVKTDSLTFTGAARVDANIAAINNSTTGVNKLSAHLPAVLTVIVGVGSTTTAIVLNAATGIDGAAPSAVDDFYKGRVLIFTSGALAGQATSVSSYTGASVTLTVVALTGSAVAAVTAVLV